ncbi:membrane protein containing DUF1634 [mine drainage metagenome]|uniref:Membrane protein containing DUF1634 n=1 Tax=mine drainage metagenome TaxID=410659 RepID=T1BUM0_9ZZZZ
MFGIGSGVLKVLALDGALRVPFKVATVTSNFMIGVTACAGAGTLLAAGYVNPVLTAPVGIGSTVGAIVGSHILPGARTLWLRVLFFVVVRGLAIALSILFGALIAFGVENPAADSSSVIAINPIANYLSLGGLASGLWAGAPEAYLTLGTLTLLVVPIARVRAGFYFFHRNGEILVARITLTVFVLLVLGLVVIGPLIR